MKRIIKIMFLAALLLYTPSCADFLDIVPDNTITLDDYFERKEMALGALAKVYSYLPYEYFVHQSSYLLGDEWMGRTDWESNTVRLFGFRVMRGLQNSNSPILAYWSELYQGIRSANIFIENVDNVVDMTDVEKKEYKAQAKFLKAYYHFILLQYYGPIAIMDNLVALDAMSDDLFHKRSKVEDCFNYIIKLINESIPDLKERASLNDLGQIDRIAAMGIKARIMLFRASPFLNGNKEYYGDFLDFDGQPFFPLEYNPEKWKDAADAAEEAIQLCLVNGMDLYTFEDVPYIYDREDYDANPNLKTLYSLRMLVVEPWNKELVWGLTSPYVFGSGMHLSDVSNIRLPKAIADESNIYAGQWLGASYKMLERYYTNNGLPIDDDRTFDRNTMYRLTQTPGGGDAMYDSIRGIMQTNKQTINLYMNRELRFYANLGITGGWWRGHTRRIATDMYAGGYGGSDPTVSQTNFLCTGVGVQKFVHPESKAGSWSHMVEFPYPIMRMADLYLIKAEALNEYYGPSQEVFDAINKVRIRAGIPTVEKAWTSPMARRPGKHLDKNVLRDIILQERGIEFAFEGHRFWDMHRHRKAVGEFSAPISGWTVDRYALRDFFVLKTLQARRFTAKDYLWPISLSETNKNANLKQNPGW